MDEARAVRDYWFGTQPLSGAALEARLGFWFGAAGAPQDEQIRTRFGALVERALAGELASWADGPRRRLSLILLLDQFPRNIFRGTARAFEGDRQALALTLSGMQSAADAALDVVERMFFYLPLEHAESLDAQDEALAAYRRLLAEAPPQFHETFAGTLRHVEEHRAIIERFGRVPPRNQVLGRASTEAEEKWLGAGGAGFGQ